MKSRSVSSASGAARYVRKSIQQVRREYQLAASAREGFQRAKWGSRAGMHNAFALGLAVIPWAEVDDWLDIGCGEADFFAAAERKGRRFTTLRGWDLAPAMLLRAEKKRLKSPVAYSLTPLQSLSRKKTPKVDLVTLVGVLQQCGMRPAAAARALAKVTRRKKYLFLTTKNASWREFTTGRLTPEPNHSWFTPDALAQAFGNAGFQILRLEGFIPASNRVVPLEDSHTMFLLARRKA